MNARSALLQNSRPAVKTPTASRMLVVEDDANIRHLLEIHLRDLAAAVESVDNGIDGLNRASNNHYGLIVLDIMLPGIDGLEICKRIRAQDIQCPVLMLTAKSTEMDRVLGLELGADDYLTKPFSVLELWARVKAILRRTEHAGLDVGHRNSDVIETAGLRIEISSRHVAVDNNPVELTAREFDLLLHFVRHPETVYSRAQLLDEVWGYSHDGYEHTVNSHINRLRKKIDTNPKRARYIETVWGVGYRFNGEPHG